MNLPVRICAVILFPALIVMPTRVEAESLQEAFAKAYLSNPTLEARRAQLRAVDENVAQALAGYQPDIRVATALTKSRVETNPAASGVNADKSREPWNASLTASLNFYKGGETVASVARSEKFKDAQLVAQGENLELEPGTGPKPVSYDHGQKS